MVIKMIKTISYKDTLPIRQAVLWPDKPMEYLKLDQDETGTHFGYFLDDSLVAVISCFIKNNELQFRKFACLDEYQGRGIGTLLLKYTMEFAKTNDVNSIWCNARVTATSLYKKFGLVILENSTFFKGSVEYVIMKKETN